MRPCKNRSLAILLPPLLSAAIASAISPDPGILSLVPPGAQMVAGITEPPQHGLRETFLLIAGNNQIDLRDFFALSGIDDTRVVDQVILVTGDVTGATEEEHSLLVSGHFNQARIFKAAVENHSGLGDYRGQRVLVVRPFPRDPGAFKDVRWLAVIDQKVAIFGTIEMVREELDRHLAGVAVDPNLKERIHRLDPRDGTWCTVKSFVNSQNIRRALNSLSPTLGDLAQDGAAFQFGTRFGGQVRIEYEVSSPQSASACARPGSDSIPQPLAGAVRSSSLLAAPSGGTPATVVAHGVVKLSRSQYEKWIAGVSELDNELSMRASPAADQSK
jgi:hypothetical protein